MFDHRDPKYAIPGYADASDATLEQCGGFNPEYFLERYRNALNIRSSKSIDRYRHLLRIKNVNSAKYLVDLYLEKVQSHFLNPHPHFNEALYRGLNEDVDALIRSGRYTSGYHHWLLVGCHQARNGLGEPQGQAGDEAAEYQRATASRAPSVAPNQISADGTPILTEKTARLARALQNSGVIDRDAYLRRHRDIAAERVDPYLHYVTQGYREQRWVHPFFDDAFYLSQNPSARRPGVVPLLHYIQFGARRGAWPHAAFDPAAYCAAFGIDPALTNPLGHFNETPGASRALCRGDFDPEFYLKEYADLAAAKVDPLVHFVSHGVHEGRWASADFDTRYYYEAHLGGDYAKNAFIHWLQEGKAKDLPTRPAASSEPTVAREIAHFSMPGPAFEAFDPSISQGERKRARLYAFYLPQFHAFPENDAWWGAGFTEWRNLPRALPRFAGHYQPRIPRDLGYYDLGDVNVLRRQAEMARKAGIDGFAFYFYWFNRKRLMDGPLDALLADRSIDLPFYLIWANENWTRRWDGMESDVLIQQDYSAEDDEALVDCFQRHFQDPRYLRIDGRPFLVIYRADSIPDCAETLETWRALFRTRHDVDPLFFVAQTFGTVDPRERGFDGAMEFPPHKIVANATNIRAEQRMLDTDYRGLVVDYDEVAAIARSEPDPDYALIRTVYPSWDNNARRPDSGQITVNATPDRYQAWLESAIEFAERKTVGGQSLVMINAWNEWAEGAYLEPDIYYGSAFLNATARAVTSEDARYRGEKFKVLLVGHDACRNGAQMNLLHKAKVLQDRFGCEVRVVLLGPGDMEADYRAAVDTTITTRGACAEIFAELAEQGFRRAILNTVVTGFAAPILKEFGYHVVSLVHELPRLMSEYGLQAEAAAIARHADDVVFAAQTVADAFLGFVSAPVAARVSVLPQGVYQVFDRQDGARQSVRDELGLPDDARIVLNIGFGDLRKGVDRFCRIAAAMREERPDVHFVWAGDQHPDMLRWIAPDAVTSDGAPAVRFLGQRSDIDRLVSAADAFFLSSREDPFPSVVLEALQVGLPVIAARNSGGIDDLLGAHPETGACVDVTDTAATVAAIAAHLDAAEGPAGEKGAARRTLMRRDFDYASYVFDLLRLSTPDLRKVCAVVLSYNYEPYIGARLRSVLDQTYPLFSVTVIDDASVDGSREVIEDLISRSGRSVRTLFNETNAGSVYAQWARAGEIADADLLWIAEADDLAAPTLVERLAQVHAGEDDLVLAFCDSRSIDQDGLQVMPSYKPYAATEGEDLLQKDEVFRTTDFARRALATKNLLLNGSAVLWNTEAFRGAVREIAPTLKNVRLAGDWLLYAQACRQEGSVGYVADPLNIHRRHEKSVTTSLDVEGHVAEIRDAQAFVKEAAGLGARELQRQSDYLAEVTAYLKAKAGQD